MSYLNRLSNLLGAPKEIVKGAIQEVAGGSTPPAVTSVNTKTGDVILSASDVNAIDSSKQNDYDSYATLIDTNTNDVSSINTQLATLINDFEEFKDNNTLHKLEVFQQNVNIVIPTTSTNLGILLGLENGTFYDTSSNKITPLNNTSILNFKFGFNGSFNGGGGQGIELLATIGTTTQTFSITKSDNDQNGFTILGWFGIDKDGSAVNNGIQFDIMSVDDAFTINNFIFSVIQNGKST